MNRVGEWFKGLSKIGKTGAVIAGLFVASSLAAPFTSGPPVELQTLPFPPRLGQPRPERFT